MNILEQISSAVEKGKIQDVETLTQQALDEGTDPKTILDKGLLEGILAIGEKWKRNEVFIPEVLIAAKGMSTGAKILEDKLLEAGVEPKGTVVIGTVKGDLHDIGKNLVTMMVKGAGFNVIDIGVDKPASEFVKAAKENNAKVILVSALLTTTMPYIKNIVEEFEKEGIRDAYTIMAGGAPVTAEYVAECGGDFYTKDAVEAADKVKAIYNS